MDGDLLFERTMVDKAVSSNKMDRDGSDSNQTVLYGKFNHGLTVNHQSTETIEVCFWKFKYNFCFEKKLALPCMHCMLASLYTSALVSGKRIGHRGR